jgi:uncharacterized membrane protein (UPF0127 family)
MAFAAFRISMLLLILLPFIFYSSTGISNRTSFSLLPVSIKSSGLNETIFVRIGSARLLVEIADTPRKRSIGLMFREKLEDDRGMLFVFPEEDYLSFWMKNTKIPLSLGYFNKDGILLEIHHMKPNQTHTTYSSRSKAIYALEVNQGWFEKNGIQEGAVLIPEKPLLGR